MGYSPQVAKSWTRLSDFLFYFPYHKINPFNMCSSVTFSIFTRLCNQGFSVAQMVKNLPTMWETWVWYLGWEDPLEEGMVTHASILAWRIPWTKEPDKLQSLGSQRVRHDWVTDTHTHTQATITTISFWNICITPQRNPVPLAAILHLCLLQLLTTIYLLSVSGFVYLGISYKRNHKLYGLLKPVSLTQRCAFKVLPYFSMH